MRATVGWSAAFVGLLFALPTAWAGWPPPPDATPADLSDPANWPNDGDYGYSDSSPGQWPLYCFVPVVAEKVTDQESAAGMCVDSAWRRTIGVPETILAAVGGGVSWEDADLIAKVQLSLGELVNHKPLHTDGLACGGEGEVAGFDCDGDGVVTVGDYQDSPNLNPPAGSGHPLGDVNGNGKLDPQDLILNFSDGIDDDGNGYVDDIAGWDFLKDDNDPADDSGRGSGNPGGRLAAAGTNNGIGGAGVCPMCRFLPVRAAGPLADAGTLGKGIAFAVDRGARVALCDAEIDGHTAFLAAAVAYAHQRGVVVVGSVGGAGSRFHAPLSVLEGALAVSAVTTDADSLAQTTTFLARHPRSNFGAQILLAGAGPGGPEEAAGAMAGIAGLLLSARTGAGALAPPLSAGEVEALLVQTTTHDRRLSSDFEQHSGYGRAHAGAAVGAVAGGLIPPEIHLTAPGWFTPLKAGGAPVELRGTVSAQRADSYDFSIEWAPGVEPLESDFKALPGGRTGIPPEVVTGLGGSLTQLDPAAIDPTHLRDADSPRGENDAAFTVRVRASARYAGATVSSEARRVFSRIADSSLAEKFPLHLGESAGSPKLADLDGDGVRDLVVAAGGHLHVYKVSATGPVELAGFPFATARIDGLQSPAPGPQTPVYLSASAYQSGGINPTLGLEPIAGAPAIADLDGDETPEIVFATTPGTVYVIGHDGALRQGWPKRLPSIPSCVPSNPNDGCSDASHRVTRGIRASPVLADLDRDGALDIIVASLDGLIYAFHADDTLVAGWPVAVHYTGALADEPPRSGLLATPAVADFNDDGYPDLLIGSSEPLAAGRAAAVYLVDGRGTAAPQTILPGWPVTLPSLALLDPRAEGIAFAGAIGSFNGVLAGVVHANGGTIALLPANPGAQATLGALPAYALPQAGGRVGLAGPAECGPLTSATSNDMVPVWAAPALGDFDQDGVPDVVTAGASSVLAASLAASGGEAARGEKLLGMWSGSTGAMLPASPMVLSDYAFGGSAVVADLDGDGYPEAVLGTGGHLVHAVDACGREPAGFPKATGQSVAASLAVGDLDGDHLLELVASTVDGWVYVWRTAGRDDGIVTWESAHHDNRNSNSLLEPLEQGSTTSVTLPLTEATCRPPPPGDAGVLDGGGPDAASADSAADASAAADDAALLGPADAGGVDPGIENGSSGCSCSTNSAGPEMAFLLLALVYACATRRR
ncbi:MAG: FG-GAP repeat protein [Deltaproteobacteria bacterium]|nr:FG-GAP repeat protein [Deltaproteobacteria bacterium]